MKLNKTVETKDNSKTLSKVNLIESSGSSGEEYSDRYEGIKTEIVDTTRFDENLDLSTTHLGRIDMTQDKDLMVEQRFPISESGYTVGKLMDGMECQILLDTGANKIFYVQVILFNTVRHCIPYPSLHQRHREFK